MSYKRRPADFILFLTVLILLTVGIVMVFSASSVKAGDSYDDPFYFLKRQLTWGLIGVAAMWSVMKMDYQQLKRMSGPALLVSMALLVLVLIPGIGKEVNGSQRWLGVGSLVFQPSELIKLSLVMFFAGNFSRYQDKLKYFGKGVLPHLAILGVVCGLILLQPDLGTAVAIAGTALLMLLAGGARISHLMGLAMAGLGAVATAIAIEPYRMARFTAFINPWADPANTGFQTIQSLLALGSGGLFGLGLGRSRQKFWYLPEQHTDFIFAIIGEELGFIGTTLVVLLFFLFVWRGLRIAITAPDNYGSLLAVGVTSMIALQAIINMGVVTGSLPVTGITLPFISYGGSSLLFTLIGIGILLNISRYCTTK